MTDQPDSSSALQSRSQQVSSGAYLIGKLIDKAPAMVALTVVGKTLTAQIPRLYDAWIVTGKWQPLAVALIALGMLCIPVDTINLFKAARNILPWKRMNNGKD